MLKKVKRFFGAPVVSVIINLSVTGNIRALA
jgi:hypothetical protein